MLDGNGKEVETIETTAQRQEFTGETTSPDTGANPDNDEVADVPNKDVIEEKGEEDVFNFPKNPSLSQVSPSVVVPPQKKTRGQDLGLQSTQMFNTHGVERYSILDEATGKFPVGFERYLIVHPKYINGVPPKDGSSFRASSRGGGKDLQNQMLAKNGKLATHLAFDGLSLIRQDIDKLLIIPALTRYQLPIGKEFFNLGDPGRNYRYPRVVMDTFQGYNMNDEPIIHSEPVPFATHILEKFLPTTYVVRIVCCDVCIFDY